MEITVRAGQPATDLIIVNQISAKWDGKNPGGRSANGPAPFWSRTGPLISRMDTGPVMGTEDRYSHPQSGKRIRFTHETETFPITAWLSFHPIGKTTAGLISATTSPRLPKPDSTSIRPRFQEKAIRARADPAADCAGRGKTKKIPMRWAAGMKPIGPKGLK